MEKVFMTHDEVTQLLKDGYDMGRGWSQGKGQPKWHKVVYDKWREMWKRCYDPTHDEYIRYKDVIISDEFKLLSNYVKWIESQPRFEEFCSTHKDILWSIDKDAGGGHYFPHMMVLTTASENSKEAINRCGNSHLRSELIRKKTRKPVIGISNKNIILLSCVGDALNYGFKSTGVSMALKKKLPHYKRYKWFYINYKHNKVYRRI